MVILLSKAVVASSDHGKGHDFLVLEVPQRVLLFSVAPLEILGMVASVEDQMVVVALEVAHPSFHNQVHSTWVDLEVSVDYLVSGTDVDSSKLVEVPKAPHMEILPIVLPTVVGIVVVFAEDVHYLETQMELGVGMGVVLHHAAY